MGSIRSFPCVVHPFKLLLFVSWEQLLLSSGGCGWTISPCQRVHSTIGFFLFTLHGVEETSSPFSPFTLLSHDPTFWEVFGSFSLTQGGASVFLPPRVCSGNPHIEGFSVHSPHNLPHRFAESSCTGSKWDGFFSHRSWGL